MWLRYKFVQVKESGYSISWKSRHVTTMGSQVPYGDLNLPPSRRDFPAFTPAEAGTRFSDCILTKTKSYFGEFNTTAVQNLFLSDVLFSNIRHLYLYIFGDLDRQANMKADGILWFAVAVQLLATPIILASSPVPYLSLTPLRNSPLKTS